MVYLLNQATQIVLMVLFLLLFIGLMIGGIIVLNNMNKKKRKDSDEYYQKLDRYDAKDFLDIEDIVDEMVIMDGHRRFVAGIRCTGFNYRAATTAQKVSVFQGYLSFIKTITRPVLYRQYYVPMSMDHTQLMYVKRYEELERELFHKVEDRNMMLQKLNEIKGKDIRAEEQLIQEIEKLQKEMDNMQWRRLHMKEQIDFMEKVCDPDMMEASLEEAYLVAWEYNPADYNVDMNEEDIHRKAIEELSIICNGMISTLSGANVRGYRCTTEDLIEMFYHHTHPVSSVEFKMPSILNSSYFDEYVTTDNLEKLKETAYEEAVVQEGAEFANRIMNFVDAPLVRPSGEEAEV